MGQADPAFGPFPLTRFPDAEAPRLPLFPGTGALSRTAPEGRLRRGQSGMQAKQVPTQVSSAASSGRFFSSKSSMDESYAPPPPPRKRPPRPRARMAAESAMA